MTDKNAAEASLIAELRNFFRDSSVMAEFVETHQVGPSPWGSTIDHSGRLILMPPDRDVVHAIQVRDEGGFQAVTYADPLSAFDPETPLSRKVEGTAWIVGEGFTPREAFEALCADLEIDVGSDRIPGP